MKALVFKPKPVIWISSLCLAFFLVPCPSLALTVQEVPNPRQVYGGWVTDQAEILKPETETQLNQMSKQLEAKNGAEMAVVTVPETAPAASPKEFTTDLFNYWKIGKKGKDNGVLFLISVKDRRVEIETGYGVEGILPDAKVGNIIETQITPRFKQRDFDGGTLAGTKALVMVLQGQEPNLDNNQNQAPPSVDWFWMFWIMGMVLILAIKILQQPIFLEPEGRSRTKYWRKWFGFENAKTVKCLRCKQPMQQVDSDLVTSQLTKPEQVAENLGGTEFIGWQCPHCSPQAMHIRAYEKPDETLSMCPHCQELTVLRGEPRTLREPGLFEDGLLSTPYDCKCCFYHQDIETSMSPLMSGGSSESGGGGGSFGGGDSGGGGAGGSW
jgi:uncharacterized protein